MKNIIDLVPNKRKKVSASDFLKMTSAEKRNVESFQFVPPEIGSDSFGIFSITMKNPTYSTHGETK